MADEKDTQGVLTLVCEECGNEMYFSEKPPPPHLVCSRCGGTVFRQFFTPTDPDQAMLSYLDETARSVALDEESPDITSSDLHDLNNP
ncbi:MAG TPA: hypothetical protein VFJ96_10030 [Gemmatimonadaceae bacterium]|nr:hypothetical protein [Gemmatimonadaceae bacterium]